jgi:aryl-alcohol dehydrogenase-like predicted oxidoreductase
VAAAIDPLLPMERSGETLSRKALWVVASTPGVGSVLNGMRTPAYVDDTLGILRWPPLASALPVYEVIRGLQLPRR